LLDLRRQLDEARAAASPDGDLERERAAWAEERAALEARLRTQESAAAAAAAQAQAAAEAQLAINGHFFRPWPPEDAWADVIGWAVSDGDVYSPFQNGWGVALALGADGEAAIVSRAGGDDSGMTSDADFVVDDAVGASERILTGGEVTATWGELHPRTAVGVDDDGDVVFMVVDGRQDGVSEGMTTPEVAEVMAAFAVVDAINLDGGGSTTLVVADPEPRLVNTPVGYVLPNSERDNGSNLAVFARPR